MKQERLVPPTLNIALPVTAGVGNLSCTLYGFTTYDNVYLTCSKKLTGSQLKARSDTARRRTSICRIAVRQRTTTSVVVRCRTAMRQVDVRRRAVSKWASLPRFLRWQHTDVPDGWDAECFPLFHAVVEGA